MRNVCSVLIVLGIWLVPVVSAQDAAKVQRAQKVWTAEKCSRCHSIAGKGNAKGKLDDVGTKLTEAEIRQWILSPEDMAKKSKATRKPPMKAHDKLSKEDVDALVTYLAAQKAK
jgi:mono/diheme cytochrome c family protein